MTHRSVAWRVGVLCGVIAILVLPLASQAQPDGQPQARLRDLGRALLQGVRYEDDVRERVEEIRKLTRIQVLAALNTTSPQAATYQEIKSAFAGMYTMNVIRKRLDGQDAVIVSYSIAHGPPAIPDQTPVIEAFVKRAAEYEAVDTIGLELEGCDVRLEELTSPGPSELWFLAHGQQSRVMQYHERMAIHSFDGRRFKQQWAGGTPLRSPSFQMTANRLMITYEDEERSGPLLIKTIEMGQGGALELSTLPKR